MAFLLTADQQVNATVTFADKFGNPVATPVFDAIPTWASDNAAVLTATAAADGMSADLITVGPVGVANVSFSGLVGGMAINAALEIDVSAGAIASAVIVPGTPTNK